MEENGIPVKLGLYDTINYSESKRITKVELLHHSSKNRA